MISVYIAALIAASFRLTDIVATDDLFAPIRSRLKWKMLTCTRCVSVWAAAACLAAYYVHPLVNVPLAISWAYMLQARLLGKSAAAIEVFMTDGEVSNVVSRIDTQELPLVLARAASLASMTLRQQQAVNNG